MILSLIAAVSADAKRIQDGIAEDYAVVCPFCGMRYPAGVTKIVGLKCGQCKGNAHTAETLCRYARAPLAPGAEPTPEQLEVLSDLRGGVGFEARTRLRYLRKHDSTEGD